MDDTKEIALKHVVHGAPQSLLLLQQPPFGLQHLVLLLQEAYLVIEGDELVVQGFNLLLLLSACSLDVGVYLQLQGARQALVHGNPCDAPDPSPPKPTSPMLMPRLPGEKVEELMRALGSQERLLKCQGPEVDVLKDF